MDDNQSEEGASGDPCFNYEIPGGLLDRDVVEITGEFYGDEIIIEVIAKNYKTETGYSGMPLQFTLHSNGSWTASTYAPPNLHREQTGIAQRSKQFHIRILALNSAFEVFLNDKQLCRQNHLIPLLEVTHISIDGEAEFTGVEFKDLDVENDISMHSNTLSNQEGEGEPALSRGFLRLSENRRSANRIPKPPVVVPTHGSFRKSNLATTREETDLYVNAKNDMDSAVRNAPSNDPSIDLYGVAPVGSAEKRGSRHSFSFKKRNDSTGTRDSKKMSLRDKLQFRRSSKGSTDMDNFNRSTEDVWMEKGTRELSADGFGTYTATGAVSVPNLASDKDKEKEKKRFSLGRGSKKSRSTSSPPLEKDKEKKKHHGLHFGRSKKEKEPKPEKEHGKKLVFGKKHDSNKDLSGIGVTAGYTIPEQRVESEYANPEIPTEKVTLAEMAQRRRTPPSPRSGSRGSFGAHMRGSYDIGDAERSFDSQAGSYRRMDSEGASVSYGGGLTGTVSSGSVDVAAFALTSEADKKKGKSKPVKLKGDSANIADDLMTGSSSRKGSVERYTEEFTNVGIPLRMSGADHGNSTAVIAPVPSRSEHKKKEKEVKLKGDSSEIADNLLGPNRGMSDDFTTYTGAHTTVPLKLTNEDYLSTNGKGFAPIIGPKGSYDLRNTPEYSTGTYQSRGDDWAAEAPLVQTARASNLQAGKPSGADRVGSAILSQQSTDADLDLVGAAILASSSSGVQRPKSNDYDPVGDAIVATTVTKPQSKPIQFDPVGDAIFASTPGTQNRKSKSEYDPAEDAILIQSLEVQHSKPNAYDPVGDTILASSSAGNRKSKTFEYDPVGDAIVATTVSGPQYSTQNKLDPVGAAVLATPSVGKGKKDKKNLLKGESAEIASNIFDEDGSRISRRGSSEGFPYCGVNGVNVPLKVTAANRESQPIPFGVMTTGRVAGSKSFDSLNNDYRISASHESDLNASARLSMSGDPYNSKSATLPAAGDLSFGTSANATNGTMPVVGGVMMRDKSKDKDKKGKRDSELDDKGRKRDRVSGFFKKIFKRKGKGGTSISEEDYGVAAGVGTDYEMTEYRTSSQLSLEMDEDHTRLVITAKPDEVPLYASQLRGNKPAMKRNMHVRTMCGGGTFQVPLHLDASNMPRDIKAEGARYVFAAAPSSSMHRSVSMESWSTVSPGGSRRIYHRSSRHRPESASSWSSISPGGTRRHRKRSSRRRTDSLRSWSTISPGGSRRIYHLSAGQRPESANSWSSISVGGTRRHRRRGQRHRTDSLSSYDSYTPGGSRHHYRRSARHRPQSASSYDSISPRGTIRHRRRGDKYGRDSIRMDQQLPAYSAAPQNGRDHSYDSYIDIQQQRAGSLNAAQQQQHISGASSNSSIPSLYGRVVFVGQSPGFRSRIQSYRKRMEMPKKSKRSRGARGTGENGYDSGSDSSISSIASDRLPPSVVKVRGGEYAIFEDAGETIFDQKPQNREDTYAYHTNPYGSNRLSRQY